ncbi:MAG TPA: peptide deformylase [Candidatus Limiplasma sp.]|nr:peptide deformylase [Candidatus Limiplasma sp.]HPS80292.1 peptide deformylase [Candidatus Limiplasma sp.]
MATRKIVEIGDEKLRKHCKPVEKFDMRLKILLKDMAETMYKNDGAGLAAPQVGILKRVCVVDVGDHLYELVNPVVVSSEGEQVGPEGCLSIPGRAGVVSRPMKVLVKAQNAKGEPIEVSGEGFLARALCHEIDHLDGQLYVDIMEHEIFQDDDEDDGAEPSEAEAPGKDQPAASEGEVCL